MLMSSLSTIVPSVEIMLPTTASPFCPMIPYIPLSNNGPHISSSTLRTIELLLTFVTETLSSAVPMLSVSLKSGFNPPS